MTTGKTTHITPADVLHVLSTYRRRWLIPTCIGAVLGILYAAVRPDQWEASQALLIRNEAANNVEGLGKFRQIDDMKVVQETVLELTKSRQVLQQALAQVGSPSGAQQANWPTATAIDELRKHVKIAPPKGAEFGKTQMFYLKVVDPDRERAVALASAICDALQLQFQEVLTRQGESMVRELTNSVDLAQAGVNEASKQLEEMERTVGADLAELRILQASPASSSELRQRVVFLEGELRRAHTQRKTNEELLHLLHAADEDTTNLIAAPNSLLEAQPSLRRLKEGLIDAQLKTSQLLGGLTLEHPTVKAAMESERAVRDDIHAELKISIRGLESDSRLLDSQAEVFKKQLDETNARLARIAELRTRYSNLVANVEHANKLLQTAETSLADARAKQSGALLASLLDRIDTPDTGIRPIGPGRAVIALGGAAGGFLVGLGVVVLTVPAPAARSSAATPAIETALASDDSLAARPAIARPRPAAPLQPPAERPDAPRPRPAARATEAHDEKLSLKQALLRVQPTEAGRA